VLPPPGYFRLRRLNEAACVCGGRERAMGIEWDCQVCDPDGDEMKTMAGLSDSDLVGLCQERAVARCCIEDEGRSFGAGL
jgi:hypothetical protein